MTQRCRKRICLLPQTKRSTDSDSQRCFHSLDNRCQLITGYNRDTCRSQWPRGLRHRSAAAGLLGLWVRIPPGAWMSVCCECCVLSSRSLCDALITRPEESYWLWCVAVCDLETSRMRRPWPALGRSATKKIEILSILKRHTIVRTLEQKYNRTPNSVHKNNGQFYSRFFRPRLLGSVTLSIWRNQNNNFIVL